VAEVKGAQATAPAPSVGVILLLAAVIGVGAGAAVVAFLAVEHRVAHLVWETLPETFGATGVPNWWVYVVLILGAVGVWAALKLPGRGGHRPLDGLGFEIGPSENGSVALASLI